MSSDIKQVIKESKVPMRTLPTGSFTADRKQARQIQDIRLISHFAAWLSALTGESVGADTICQDLKNGVVLCKVMMMVPGTAITKFHELPAKGAPMDEFKARENVAQFQAACQRLALPQVFGNAELENENYGQIAGTLVFVAHTCAAHGIGIKQMDQEIRDRVGTVDEMTRNILESNEASGAAAGTPESSETANEAQAAGRVLTWWQKILVALGFGDYIDLDADKLRAYATQLRARVEAKVGEVRSNVDAKRLETKKSFSEYTEQVKGQANAYSDQIQAKVGELKKQVSEKVAPLLPEAVKAKLGV